MAATSSASSPGYRNSGRPALSLRSVRATSARGTAVVLHRTACGRFGAVAVVDIPGGSTTSPLADLTRWPMLPRRPSGFLNGRGSPGNHAVPITNLLLSARRAADPRHSGQAVAHVGTCHPSGLSDASTDHTLPAAPRAVPGMPSSRRVGSKRAPSPPMGGPNRRRSPRPTRRMTNPARVYSAAGAL